VWALCEKYRLKPAFRAGDIEGVLATHHKPGREPSLNEVVVAELLQGLETGRWKRIKEIRKWLSDEHKVGLSYRGVHYWLEKVGASLKVPRKSHAKKDEGQSVLFKEGLADKLVIQRSHFGCGWSMNIATG
jgi:transposase